MRIDHADSAEKGWYVGDRHSNLPISVGYANKGIDEPHVHLVIHTPSLFGEQARGEKSAVPRTRLGL